MNSSIAISLLLLLFGSAEAFFTPQKSSTVAFHSSSTSTSTSPTSSVARHHHHLLHHAAASLLTLHASKNKQKVSSRTNWANARGYFTSSSSTVAAAAATSESTTTTKKSPPKIIIAGAPASGKGTQCEIIQSKYGVIHLSTGDMLRAAVAAQTTVGVLAKEYMDAGKLVPDEVIIGVVS